MNDGKIIELFFERSDEAIIELSEKYGRLAISLARNILGDEGEAEECVNDAYLAAWNNIPPERPSALGAYLCGIVRNLSYSRLRRQSAAKRRPEALIALEELSEVIPSSESVDGAAEAKALSDAIDRFLGTLTADDRAIFLRRYWFSDSVSDIAARLNRRPHYISVRLSRVRAKLKKFLENEGITI